jgi:predicted amidohydrolase/GNAT superfamily N-acetyltransferase
MEELDLKDFETRIRVRPMAAGDFEAVVAMQELCFPGMETWSTEQLESMTAIFPDGQMVVEYQGRVVASCCSLIVDFDLYSDWHNWKEIADSGFIRNHLDDGDTMYGIEVMVHPEFRGLRLARRLYDARKQIVRERNLARIIVGGRIPGYGKRADEMSAREYVEQVMAKNLFDPVLTVQTANGFVLKRLIPGYMPADSASRGYATFLEWTNLDHVAGGQQRLHSVVPARICVMQYEMRGIDSFDEFEQQCEFFIDTAADYKSDFILFPELFTTQLLSTFKIRRPEQAARKLAEFTPQYLDFFTRMAVSYNINIIGGSTFVIEDDSLYNIAYLFKRDGTVGKQYKLHVTPAERRWWGVQPGPGVEVFDTDCGRIAILICYDIEFPEAARIAASKGARIIFVPFNTDERHGYLRVRHCALARCVENHIFTAIAGCTGNLPFVDHADVHYAQSGIFSPSDFQFARDGVVAECNPNIETVVIHDVDLQLLRRHRLTGTVQNWNDRRKDLYKILYYEDGQENTV